MDTDSNDMNGKDSYSLRELGDFLGAKIKGDPELRVRGIAPVQSASPDQLSFLTDSKYRHVLSECRAAALIVSPEFKDLDFRLLITSNPSLALAKVAGLFSRAFAEPFEVHPTAIIDGTAVLEGKVAVGPYTCIGAGCRIGGGTRIGAGCFIGPGVQVGEGCAIDPRVTIMNGCVVGNRVIIHSGTVIGSDGFGYAQDERGRHYKIPQTGIVRIDDDVEIGANVTVDRATFGATHIKRGAKIDNLVMLAHNVVVGEDVAIVAQVGVSGSTHIGDRVMIAGQAGLVGHIEIGDEAKIGAQAGVMNSVKAGHVVVGSPALSHDEFFRNIANIRRLPRLKEQVKRLSERVQGIEEALRDGDGHHRD
jgi:UDP-3-O-[3-hydroxymyristoyl] glucosamine N-acyltransferase